MKTITVDVNADDDPGTDEGFKVTLSDATGATIDRCNKRAEGLIRNDDIAAPVFSIAPDDADKAEGTDTSTPFTFTITRIGDISEESTVTWTVKGSTAEVPDAAKCNDFVGGGFPADTVTFLAGEDVNTITVDVNADDDPGPDEGFKVSCPTPTAPPSTRATKSPRASFATMTMTRTGVNRSYASSPTTPTRMRAPTPVRLLLSPSLEPAI